MRDDGEGVYGKLPSTPNPDPWWEEGRKEEGYPYLCVQSGTLKIQAVLKIPSGADPDSSYSVKGKASTANNGTLEFTGTATIKNGKLWTDWMSSSAAFITNKVQFLNPLAVKWTLRVDGSEEQDIGTTHNPVYVCLKGIGPNPDDFGYEPPPSRTTVHLACSVEGATTAAGALVYSFSLLILKNFKAWNAESLSWTRLLYYYRTGYTASQNGTNITADLLQNPNSTAQCRPWAYLLYDAASLNWNDSATIIQMTKILSPLKSTSGTHWAIMVKSWTPSSFPGETKTLDFADAVPEMLPAPTPPDVYGDFRSLDGIAGQNSPTPQEKVFAYHMVVKLKSAGSGTEIFYDPSYGTALGSLAAIKEALVNAFQTHDAGPKVMLITQSTEPLEAETYRP